MPKSPLFSTYRQGENRVTSSVLAVFERIDLALVQEILARAAGRDVNELPMITFRNQVAGRDSVPDGEISGRFRFLFEVKTQRGAVRADQLKGHLNQLDGAFGQELLFLITPDEAQPESSIGINDARLVWLGFENLDQAIKGVLAEARTIVSEREAYLLSELSNLIEAEGLLKADDSVAVVAAGIAYDAYLKYGLYLCQVGRTFREGTRYLGFYLNKQIKPQFPYIEHRIKKLPIDRETATELSGSSDELERRVGVAIGKIVSDNAVWAGNEEQVFVLCPPGDARNIELEQPIIHDSISAWTQSQRYLSPSQLKGSATTTSALAASS